MENLLTIPVLAGALLVILWAVALIALPFTVSRGVKHLAAIRKALEERGAA